MNFNYFISFFIYDGSKKHIQEIVYFIYVYLHFYTYILLRFIFYDILVFHFNTGRHSRFTISNISLIYLKNFRTQGKADTINLEQLITFLNEKQRDPTLNEILYPLYDEKRALEIINDYEQNEVARNESKSLINKSCIFEMFLLNSSLESI